MSGFSGEVHPLAAKYALLPDDEMADLVAHIGENGLVQACVLDWRGRLVDGRNRLRACREAGIEPRFVTNPDLTDEKKVARYIRGANNMRRHHSKGQRVASDAICRAAEGKRKNGRWVRDSGYNPKDSEYSSDYWTWAGFILDWAPALLDQVLAGTLAIESAYQQAKAVEDDAKRDERAKELAAAQLADLREHRPDLADLVDADSLPLADALIVRDKERADELKAQRDAEERRRKFTSDLGMALHYLAPLALYPERTAQLETDFDPKYLLRPIEAGTLTAARDAIALIEDTIRTETPA